MKITISWRCLGVGLGVILGFLLLWSAVTKGPGDPSLVRSLDGESTFNVSQGQMLINDLCGLYREDKVSGDYCNRLCYYKSHQILDLKADNKVVMTLMLGGQKIVLKSAQARFDDYEQLDQESEVESRVLEVANYHLALDWPVERLPHLIQLLWPAWRRSRSLRSVDRRSLWTLANQEEYLVFSVLPIARVFPKVMGSCGHFYVVEHLVPFKLKSYYTSLRAKILVHLMGTLKLFYEFLNEPLHWCDVKFDNFGLSAEYPKRFMVMDGDMVYTDTRMRRLLAKLPCRSDVDCQFFDCRAACNATLGHCGPRLNDNIDVFCSKLVQELFGSFWSTSNRYLAACHDAKLTPAQRLKELRLVWAWSLADV